MFRILRLDEKLTKSVAVQLYRVVRVVTPSFWCDHSYDATRSDSTKQFCWVASFGVTKQFCWRWDHFYDATQQNSLVELSRVFRCDRAFTLTWAHEAATQLETFSAPPPLDWSADWLIDWLTSLLSEIYVPNELSILYWSELEQSYELYWCCHHCKESAWYINYTVTHKTDTPIAW